MAIEQRPETAPAAPGRILQNPVSLIGSARRIWPLSRGSAGWLAALRRAGVALLVLLAWLLVLAWYAVMISVPILWLPWWIWTTRRRHFVYDARRYGRHIGGPG